MSSNFDLNQGTPTIKPKNCEFLLHKIIERLEVALVASPKTLCVNPKTITKSYMASLQGEQHPNHAVICFKLPQP
jgi:hypothetical protein